MLFRETACAKINLTLTVLGRRADGYHDIESLVTFAGVGDGVVFHPGQACRVMTSGPFASAIEGPNLLERTLALLRECDPGLALGGVELDKNLPVAAGLGGGSADAAALLRAVRRANPERAGRVDCHALATRLGADVPVCLAGVPALMRGIGDRIEPLDSAHPLPSLAAVLVNPRVPLPTAQVFRALAASSRSRGFSRDAGTGAASGAPAFPDLSCLLHYMRARGNDLEAAAVSLQPAIADVKAALAAQPGCLLAAMSGSGPSCFGIFGDDAEAARAAGALTHLHPGWWIVPTQLN
jgi:4-diphosphocytidyl-2-C-methyl-D-erythritol kinase